MIQVKSKFTLQEILEKEPLILLDGSAKTGGNNFLWEIHGAHSFNQLNELMLKQYLDLIYQSQSILFKYESKIYTVPEVVKETEDWLTGISDKISFLQRRARTKSSKRYQKIKGEYRDEENKSIEETLKEIHERVFDFHKFLESRNIFNVNPKNKNYDFLKETIKLLDRYIHLKKDTSYRFGNHTRDQSQDSDTDESLCAAAMSLSLSEKNCSIVTRDTDFVNLMGVTPKLIGAKDFKPFNQEFRWKIVQNPVKVYLGDNNNENYQQALSTADMKFSDKFEVYNTTHERNDEIKTTIENSWKKLYTLQNSKDTYQTPATPVNLLQ